MKKLSLEELKNTCVNAADGEAVPLFVESLRNLEIISIAEIDSVFSMAKPEKLYFVGLESLGRLDRLDCHGFKPSRLVITNKPTDNGFRVLTKADFEEKLPFANTKWDVRKWTKEQKENWQRLMFDSGYSWSGQCDILNLREDFYFLFDTGLIKWDNSDTKPNFKQMHYSDAFPETKKYKYVPIEKSIFDLKGRFENGDLFYSPDNGIYYPFTKEHHLAAAIANNKQVLERVEYKWNAEARANLEAASLPEGAEVMWLLDNQPERALEVAKIIIEANKGE